MVEQQRVGGERERDGGQAQPLEEPDAQLLARDVELPEHRHASGRSRSRASRCSRRTASARRPRARSRARRRGRAAAGRPARAGRRAAARARSPRPRRSGRRAARRRRAPASSSAAGAGLIRHLVAVAERPRCAAASLGSPSNDDAHRRAGRGAAAQRDRRRVAGRARARSRPPARRPAGAARASRCATARARRVDGDDDRGPALAVVAAQERLRERADARPGPARGSRQER